MIKLCRKCLRKGVVENMVIISLILHLSSFLSSCSRMGSPDGGWFDDTPPKVIGASPKEKAIDVRSRKLTINFDEYIKVDDPQNKVIISPPQIEMADIKASGKRIVVELKDSLKDNTTYTIDFSDAISDNNENNPMGNYTYSFSTGDHIDTLEISGYCLDAENLEPIKGILVGLYPTDSLKASADSLRTAGDSITNYPLFHRSPMTRISRTNGSGQFSIKGVAPGNYCVYALKDNDGDFVFGQKSEMIGYQLDGIEPSWKPDTRPDTIWRDSLHIDNIIQSPYTHFLPDDITLLCFQEPLTDRYLVKTERKDPEKFTLFFSYGNDSLPDIRGLNFNADKAFVLEASQKNDTLVYWLTDTTLVNQDTLRMELNYLMTDSAGMLVQHTDTIEALAKVAYEKRMKEKQKDFEKWQKEQEKKKKRNMPYDSIMPPTPLKPKFSASAMIDPNQHLYIEMPQPLARCDTAAIHLYCMVDSVWYNADRQLVQQSTRIYELKATWQEGLEYSLEIDSAAFQGIYGQVSNPIKQGMKVKGANDFSTLSVELSGMNPSDSMIVQLLDGSDKIVRQALADAQGAVDFIYLKPGTYYMRAFIDRNGNGIWDTGCYDENRQAESVYYNPEAIDCKAKWDVSRQWNINATPRYRQKPEKITKQKPDQQRKLKNRNAERAKKLGIPYVAPVAN